MKINKKLIISTIFLILMISVVSGRNVIFDNDDISQNLIGYNYGLKAANMKIFDLEKLDFLIISSNEIYDEDGLILFYVFNLNPTGYIVVCANQNLPPVIAYSFTDDFGGYGDDNILLQMLISDIKIRLENIDITSKGLINKRNSEWELIKNNYKGKLFERKIQSPIKQSKEDYLLETQWSQSSPFNNFCPIDLSSGIRSVAGCPAVAMAQILNYHQTTNGIIFDDDDDYYHSYAGNNFWIDDDFELYDFASFLELNDYFDLLMSHYIYQIPLTDSDKAAFVFACGVAAKQVYNPSGSGTFGVNQAYQAYNRFSFNNITLLDENDPDLYTRLQQNIEDGYPAHIAVVNEGWTSGHNMVVDGHNIDDFYHINFGWGGAYDGWYLLPDEIPFDLTVIEGIIVDIINEKDDPILFCKDIINWVDVEPASTVNKTFIIENIGEPNSLLSWEVDSFPSWGTWTFEPNGGSTLLAGDILTIDVEVIAPDEQNQSFEGEIVLINSENPKDVCLIDVVLSTPKQMNKIYSFIQRCFSNNFFSYNLLKQIL